MADPEADRIIIRCACRTTIAVRAWSIGKKARCPMCKRVFTVRDPASARPGARSASASVDAAENRTTGSARSKDRAPSSRAEETPARERDDAGDTAFADDADSLLEALVQQEDHAAAASDASPVDDRTSCPRCGSTAPEGQTVCFSCGHQLGTTGSDAHVHSAPVAHPEQGLVPNTRANICPSCRKALSRNAVICVDCGINVKTGRSIIIAHEDNLDEIYVAAESAIRWISWLIWFGIYPVASEAFGTRKPYVVRALAILTVVTSAWFWVYQWTDSPKVDSLQNLMLWCGESKSPSELADYYLGESFDRAELDEELVQQLEAELAAEQVSAGTLSPFQLVTHAFLHGDVLHLAGNLLFLLVLGSRVNGLIGNAWTVILYPILAVIAGLAYVVSAAQAPLHPMIGASGAIMGLAGMYLVFFPVHNVHVAFWYRLGPFLGFRFSLRLFAVRGFWVVLFYIAFDVVYTVIGLEDQVAHWAHLGGFLAGIGMALFLLCTRLVNSRGGDLLSVTLGKYAWGLVGKPR